MEFFNLGIYFPSSFPLSRLASKREMSANILLIPSDRTRYRSVTDGKSSPCALARLKYRRPSHYVISFLGNVHLPQQIAPMAQGR